MTTTVAVIGTGDGDDPRRPDLPEGVSFTVVSDHGETMEVEVDPSNRIAALEGEVRGMKERAGAASVTGDAAKVRDALTGPPATR